MRQRSSPGENLLPFDYPEQLPAPYTILVEDIPGPDEPHKHIDLIYFCRAVDGAPHETRGRSDAALGGRRRAARERARWTSRAAGSRSAVPEDVRAAGADRDRGGRGATQTLTAEPPRDSTLSAMLSDPAPAGEAPTVVRRVRLERRHTEAPLDEALALDARVARAARRGRGAAGGEEHDLEGDRGAVAADEVGGDERSQARRAPALGPRARARLHWRAAGRRSRTS